jgi:ATP dependent DNA ligase C terminal region
MKACTWVEPQVVVRVDVAEWTGADKLRLTKFVATRDDKVARKVVRLPSGSMTKAWLRLEASCGLLPLSVTRSSWQHKRARHEACGRNGRSSPGRLRLPCDRNT